MSRPFASLILLAACLTMAVLSGCGGSSATRSNLKGTYKPYTIRGKTYHPLLTADGFTEKGLASWYGPGFHGRRTACGEVYDQNQMTAAHKILPMHTMVQVENLDNGRTTVVRINDRGPFVSERIIDLSHAAARELGVTGPGTARVRIAALGDVPTYRNGDFTGTFFVQVGAFTVQENALRLLSALQAEGKPGSRIVESDIGGRLFWRVQMGTWQSMSAAENARRTMLSRFPGAFVIAD
ncbi:septal ring lytic transglycosylase RlpA family protein [Megalodesulfovibrio paquesii]